MKIQLIASDLDGTLLTDQKELSPLTRQALARAMGQGIHFVTATGRAFGAVPRELKELDGAEYIITSNGGAVYSVSAGKRIYQCVLAKESVEEILRLPGLDGVVLEAFVEGIPYSDKGYVADPRHYGATDYGAAYVKRTRRPVEDMREFVKAHAHCLDSMAFVCGDQAVRDRLRNLLKDRVPSIYITSSVSHLVEIGHEDAGKGKTLQWLLNKLDISPEHAMAFGDADNDIEMLRLVKYSVAMGNASASCREAAAYETLSNEQDGVGKAIFRFLDMRERL